MQVIVQKYCSIEIDKENSKLIFCRVKLGKNAYNTKISEEKSFWDEKIAIRKLENEHQLIVQIWNFDPEKNEQLIGESILELNSKEIDIYFKKFLENDFTIYQSGIKKGQVFIEIKWIEDDK